MKTSPWLYYKYFSRPQCLWDILNSKIEDDSVTGKSHRFSLVSPSDNVTDTAEEQMRAMRDDEMKKPAKKVQSST